MSNLDKKSKIYVRARMYPGLSISRSLGDLLAHHIGVTSKPDVHIHEIVNTDKFITIATDGVWSNIELDDLGEIVDEFGLKEPGESCALVTQKIDDMCYQEGNDTDDTTLVISYLSSRPGL